MSTSQGDKSRLKRVAALVDQLIHTIETNGLSGDDARAAAAQVSGLVEALAGRDTHDAALLAQSLQRLDIALAAIQRPIPLQLVSLQDAAPENGPSEMGKPRGAGRISTRRSPQIADKTFAKTLRRLALAVTASAVVSAPMAAAARGTGGPLLASSAMTSIVVSGLTSATVGGTVVNPDTGTSETVVEILSGGAAVRTSTGNVILLATTVNDTYTAQQASGPDKTYKVTAVHTNSDGRVDSVTLQEVGVASPPSLTQPVVVNKSSDINGVVPGPAGGNGSGVTPITFPSPSSGDLNPYKKAEQGANGGNGSDGGGVRICAGFLGCVTLGKNPSSGGKGGDGPAVDKTLDYTNWADIQTVSDNLPGVVVSSVGGNGGAGGSTYGIALPGANGGASGAGGAVTLTSSVNITTIGENAHGVFAQSRSGSGGTGGTGYGASAGGVGGAPGGGGAVTVTNNGAISTQGSQAIGIFAQSLGGGAGSGGDSYGIVGDSGGSTAGGKGGTVLVVNNGAIYTEGYSSHGIQAQSIGGTGGNAGNAGGIVALGGTGSAGGDGGQVTVVNNGGITTKGERARGVFAQSVGGGGGSGGDGGGLVAIGGTGTGGGIGDTVEVVNTGSIQTRGAFAQGVFAQSVGGGGGSGGDGGALVAIGGKAGDGNTGGQVTVDNSGAITTIGNMSSAIQAQSVGGGGGDGGTTGGGPLTIGGSGGKGGDSDVVTVKHSGDLSTKGDDSHGILAQSVGGGGGNGGSSTSISLFAGVSIGGAGASGGDGKEVEIILSPSTVTLGGVTQAVDPLIATKGDRSRGIFAQSVGGGGGNGGFAAQVAVGYGIGAGAAIGGSGDFGGAGGLVKVDGDALIFTEGDNSQGLFAQSVGGGGGAGGMALSFNFAAGETAAAAFSVALGGKGGAGGDGGEVDIHSGGSIRTEGQFATGLVAQSVGGGGGSGGYAIAFSGSAAGVASASASVGVGGAGAGGGDGKTVTVDFEGAIQTLEDDASGAMIQSIGGGGGDGGFSISGAVSVAGTAGIGASAGVGGAAGDGGIGGQVTGRIGGDVTTSGDRSTAVVIQSVGGGGGNGGFNISGGIGGGGTVGLGLSVGLGGAGGGGGEGGMVDGRAGGVIRTFGDQSGGLLVQSVGGGGGNGGFNVTGGIGGGQAVGGAMSVGLGGAGGDGGKGGKVRGEAEDMVVTTGDQSSGVVVQSLGGGGGNGAFNVAGSIGGAQTVGAAISVGVGGAGGGGGDGDEVDAFAKSISTLGDQSVGFLAQSVGGGGGSGGFNVSGAIGGAQTAGVGLSVGVGGSGGDGGDGKRVGATVTGVVTTLGDDASGVVAQSLGGGGGRGAFAVAGSISGASTGAASISVGVGGSGGLGGDAGAVTLALTGLSQTTGKNADAVLAQSVGGGGGAGGLSVGAGVAVSGAGAGTVSVAVGGSGGGGGDGAKVVLQVNDGVADPLGDLIAAVTLGDGSRGVVAQSLGGGGGDGGFSVAGGVSIAKDGAGNIGVGVGGGGGDGGDGKDVVAEITGDVKTAGADASAVLAQSVGGGGGNGGFNVTGGISGSQKVAGNLLVGVGGFGGGGGDAGAVSGFVSGDVLTQGDGSSGVTYQSLGGGGGNGGFNITGGVSLAFGSGGGAGTIGVGVGGFGGDGGDAGSVNATLTGEVTTQGDNAHGVLLQSVGGGGGDGGFNITGGISASAGSNGTLGLGVGGFGGGGGDGKDVTGVLTGDVWTSGENSFGATLQSLGGAGGNGGLNVTGSVAFTAGNNAAVSIGLGVGGFGGGGGDAGKIDATVTGQYVMSGKNADGVLAQSLGGGGGNGGLNVSGSVALSAGAAGTVSVGIGGFGGSGGGSDEVKLVRVGDTWTDGADADGVVAQSLAGGGGNGGLDVAGGLSASYKGSAGSFGLGIGGFGGDGGDAGDVTAHVTGNVIAKGHGEILYTPARTVSIVDAADPTVSTPVDLPAVRQITDGSNGVLAQSIGGGGGNGGLNVTGGVALSAPSTGSSRAITLGVGGFGGMGGDAGKVDLTIDSPSTDPVQVLAVGDDRYAVAAQSIGGGGGAGGINISGGITMDGQLTVGIGGFGGGGGLGADVTADVNADLFASGERSRGLLVESIGGGGGAGGVNISGGILPNSQAKEPAVTFGLGGSGGAANVSGDVTAKQNGQVWVDGVESVGVLVQSVAGGGGSGGLNISADLTLAGGAQSRGFALAAGIGGTGGDGADAGDVSLVSVGDVIVNGQLKTTQVTGEDPLEATAYTGGATGVLVQSIGGGGGVGGVNATGAIAPSGSPIALGVGGSGGSGGNGGAVTVTRGYADVGGTQTVVGGLIRTFGDYSNGMLVQSVGGGGGDAGYNLTVVASKGNASDNTVAGIFTVGGGGAGSGGGDTVEVRHAGDIVTDGLRSNGLVAQSIGGGGGNASYNIGLGVEKGANALNVAIGGATGAGGAGGDVTVDHDGVIYTQGDDSMGLLAQSIGGGGGNAGMDMATGLKNRNAVGVTIGRQGGAGGAAGDVKVNVDGLVQTVGLNSTAVLAQSVGGGGGVSSATTIAANGTKGKGDQAETTAVSLSIGLDGGVGATGGDVSVNADGEIYTHGADSRGIHAQSIGGGGGVGGSASTTVAMTTQATGLALGGDGGTGAASGKVTVNSAAIIKTDDRDSDGVLAQSIGGSGGLGGMVRTLEIQLGGAPAGVTQRTATISVGGSGGTGAVGDTVEVANTGTIWTEGDRSFGIRAQSVGGGGGVSGMVLNIALQKGGANEAYDLNLGGDGGTGAAAGLVEVVNEGLIYTKGDGAAGISANSIGGGGGDAGIVLDATLGFTDKQSHRYTVNLGGSGGSGGVGGDVNVINRPTSAADSGKIITEGRNAYGVLAQSIGGGGGNGSSVLSISGMKSAENSVTAGLTVGGAGGDGNDAGAVHVINDGLIQTSGEGAHGVLAQSIGGGGGNGGLAIAADILIGSTSGSPLVTLGGIGGAGGDGGSVTVDNSGRIITTGKGADGVVAQSIGGGGGDAQFGVGVTGEAKSLLFSSTLSALIGATGGGHGGAGGDVTVNHSGDITVLGQNAQAIKAESINGGGGTMTLDFSGVLGLPGQSYVDLHGVTKRADPMIVAQAGAQDASDMNAGKVTVNSSGTLQAGGANGAAVFNQSVGGGGGTVNLSLLLSGQLDEANVDAPVPVQVKIGLGGQNGQNNNGGDIDGRHDGQIVTTGDNTDGVLVQSIGGGGGRGVADITVPAGALLGQVQAVLGGENGQDERGGDVNRAQNGAIYTGGDYAMGAIIQSIGGGGGSTGVVLTGNGATGASVLASLGANGGAGLDGGAIVASFDGDMSTQGDHAVGLMAQSIGGGGGEVHVSGGAMSVALGGQSGAAGDGGALALTHDGDIVTTGKAAHAVFLQSIGGGGGAAFGDSVASTLALSAANTGDGGAIRFQQTGDIYALGQGAYGVVAQSQGGGGGWVDGVFAGTAGGQGAGGAIDLNLSGAVIATGAGSSAVFAQSQGADGGGNIHLTTSGFVRGGGGTGVGLKISGGADNIIDSFGQLSALSGLAIDTGGGNDQVNNHGLMVGDVDLGAGDNALLNASGATFVALHTIDLRDAVGTLAVAAPSATTTATFTNAGDFRVGLSAPLTPIDLANGAVFANLDALGPKETNAYYGARVIETVALDGNFVQTAGGHMAFDVAFGPYVSDRVNATGTVAVAGKGDVTLTWLENAKPVTLFATTAGTTDNGLQITDTLALDYSVHATAAGLQLDFKTKFDQGFLNANGQALGRHMNSAITLGDSSGIGRLMALIGNLRAGDEAGYARIFRELSPEPYLAPLRGQLTSAGTFSDQLFRCSAPGETALSGRCAWTVIERANGKTDGDSETMAIRSAGERLRGGFERPMRDDWALAVAVGYERLDRVLVDGGRSWSDGQGINLGLGLKHQTAGGLQAAASLSGGWQWLKTTRSSDVFDIGRGEAKPQSGYAQAEARFAYVMSQGRLFIEPALNISATALHQKRFAEHGLAGQGVNGLSDTQVIGAFNPEISFGLKSDKASLRQASVAFTVGGVFNSDDKIAMPYRLAGANADSAPAVIATALDKKALKLGLDARIIGDDRVTVRFNYTAVVGDRTDDRSAGLNIKVKF